MLLNSANASEPVSQNAFQTLLHLYAFANGLYLGIFFVIFVFGLTFIGKKNREKNKRIAAAFFLIAAAFGCFGLHNIFFQQSHDAVTAQVIPDLAFKLSAMASPIALMVLTFVYTRALRVRSYKAYEYNMQHLWVEKTLYMLNVLLIGAVVFVDDPKDVSALLLLGFAPTTFAAADLSFNGIGDHLIGRLLGILFSFLTLSTIVLAYATQMDVLAAQEPLMVSTHLFFAGVALIFCMLSIRFGYGEANRIFKLQKFDELGVLNDIHPAIMNHEFFLHYQPQVSIKTGKVCGVEALIRWQHPKKGMIPPIGFIKLAEKGGLINSITQWVIEHALKDCRRLMDKGLRIPFSINFSSENLNDEVVDFLSQMLIKHNVPAKLVRIEITESIGVKDNQNRVRRAIGRIHSLGLGLSIDDYGSGYSSAHYLKKLAASELKIDRSFIQDLHKNTNNHAIVLSTAQLAKNLHLTSVAEGVESEEELACLKALGCDVIQGYGIAKPMPFEALDDWVRTSRYANK